MAQDSFDDSLRNYSLSNPKAVLNLTCNYKYTTDQVKFKFKTPTKKQDFIYSNRFSEDMAISLPRRIFKSVQY